MRLPEFLWISQPLFVVAEDEVFAVRAGGGRAWVDPRQADSFSRMSPVITTRSVESVGFIDDQIVELAAKLAGHVQIGKVRDRRSPSSCGGSLGRRSVFC